MCASVQLRGEMLYVCVLLLGVFSSFVLSAAGLILLSSVLFVGIGVAGAIQHELLFAVLLKAVAVSITLQFAYALPLICALFRSPSVGRPRREFRGPAATVDGALAGDLMEDNLVTHLAPPTNATVHIRKMIRRIGDRRQPMDRAPGKVRPVVRGRVPLV